MQFGRTVGQRHFVSGGSTQADAPVLSRADRPVRRPRPPTRAVSLPITCRSPAVRKELESLNISEETLFPELDKSAKAILNAYK